MTLVVINNKECQEMWKLLKARRLASGKAPCIACVRNWAQPLALQIKIIKCKGDHTLLSTLAMIKIFQTKD